MPMIGSFEFTTVGSILFGRGKIARLGESARQWGTAALMIHNGDDPGRGGPVDRAAASLAAAGVRVMFHRQRGEPTIADVDAALNIARRESCDVLIGLGGGSAIDAAKAVAGLLTNGGDCMDYMEVIGKGRKIAKPAAPWIAVPTTAGTGAEVTKNAVIGSPEHKVKVSIRSEHLLARVALVDPELHIGCPPEVTAASGMDAICQLVEAFVSNNSSTITTAIAYRGFDLAVSAIKKAYDDGTNIEAREAMACAALLSGIALTNAGLGAVHGFAAPLGANFPVPHGVVCAKLLPFVVAANLTAMKSVPRTEWIMGYGPLGSAVRESRGRKQGEDTKALLGFLNRLVRDLKIPPLATYGVTEADIPRMVTLAKKTSSMKYNPVVLGDEVLAGILRSAI